MGSSLNEMVKRSFCLWLFCCLLATVSCQEPKQKIDLGTPTRYESEQKPQILELVANGSLSVKGLSAVAEKLEDAQPFGEVVLLHIKNETNKTQAFRIDCGTILRALTARYQDLVVTRSTQAELVAYGEWTGKLEVFSLQMRRHYPYKPAEYQLGNLANGDLRRFVECFCFRHPEDNADLTPAQYAIWRVADGVTFKQLVTYTRGRGNASLQEAELLEKQVQEQGTFTDQILADCQITAKFLDSNP